MVDVVISIAGKVAEMLVDPIWRQICYPFKYKTNMEELKKQVQKLTDQREMVQHSVDAAKRQGEVIEKLVENWMRSVDEFADKVVKPIIDCEEKAAGKFCFTMGIRYSLSRKAVKATNEISLLGDGTFQNVSYCPYIQRTKSVWIRGFEDFDSRMSVFEEIMKALADEDVFSIGVWGMGGVGKTTLVKRVAAQATEDGLFERIVFAEVSQSVDVEKLQEQIADELGMKLDKGNVSRKATQLRNRLKDETSILLILDNTWEEVDLDAVGIPSWNDEKTTSVTEEIESAGKSVSRQKRGLLLTSRNEHVLGKYMNKQNIFRVNILSDSEALNLFWKTVKHAKVLDLDPIAIEIVKKCAGLPIAITTIASALKDKDLPFWKDALTRLRKSNPKSIEGMEKSVYSTIELSYNVLGPEEQSLFLLCALKETGFGSFISDLIKYSMGLNLFENVDTMEEVRDRMDTLIATLKSSCLLLDDHAKGQVKMHDIIHAVAVSIASSNELMFNIPNGVKIREMLEDKLPKDSAMVSFKGGDIIELPKVLEFPNLKFFHLQPKERASLQIPNFLFSNTKELRVLDLTKFDFLCLPSSLAGLANLRTLCLDQCRIRDVTIIGELKKLEILSFLRSELELLPREIGQLTRLKILDLSHCSNLKVIAPNVLSSLSQLEELHMGRSFVHWDVDGQQNASLDELTKLSNLTTLEIQILEADIIPSDLYFGKLKNYKIFLGDVWEWPWFQKHGTSRMLKLKLNSSFNLSDGIKILLKEVEDLHLDELKGVKNVLQELNVEGFQHLKNLHIQNASQYSINNSVGWGLCSILPHMLESLVLQNLINLEMICWDRLEGQSFGKLKVIKIENCDTLKNLILPIAGHLSLLQEIQVIYCRKLEEIIFVGGRDVHNDLQESSRFEFTELRRLKLQSLPTLSRFGFIISEDDPDSFISFFDPNVLLPKLETLELCSIDFGYCETCLLSFPMVKSLRRLQNLVIRNCEWVEAICHIGESIEEETSMEMILPSLKNLNLVDLPKLERFSLDPLLDKKVSLSSLITLEMRYNSPLVIWHNQHMEKSFYFHNLRNLKIFGLGDLKYLFTSSMLNSLLQLKYLEIQNCELIEVVVVTEEKRPSALKFPNLDRLYLHGLPKLTRFGDFTGNLMDFSSMSKLWIMNCPKMEMFISHSPSINMPSRMECTPRDTEENFFCSVQPFFDEKVKLSNLKDLRLEQMDSVQQIWQSHFHSDSFSRLEVFGVGGCHKISSVFSFNMLGSLQNLHKLEVRECDSVEEIFEPESHSSNKIHDKAAPQLETLCLERLPKLKHAWNMDSQVILSFHNLRELEVEYCNSLKSLFPAIIAKGLEKLGTLYVTNCMMEEIIAMEDEAEAVSEFVFPQLRSFVMLFLSRLKSFYSGLYISKWPKLEKLTVWGCSDVEILALELQRYIENQPDTSTKGPLFFVDKDVFPSLNWMKLDWNCLANEKLHGRFSEYCYKLNSLELRGPFTKYGICPSCFLFEFPKVVSLAIYWGYLKELFSQEETVCMGKHSQLPSKLSSLELHLLTDQVLWNVHPEFNRLFQNLTTLKVSNCNELFNLLVSSTAKSLKQLTMLKISGCKKLEEIVADVEHEIDDFIIFCQLKSLELFDLPNLAIFYSGSCKIEFPCLQTVFVKQCPNMKRFSLRDLSTPRLHTLRIGYNATRWEGDLNTSLEQQYIGKTI